MAYGTIKVDTITFTNGGVDKSVTISGLVQNPTFTGNVTVTGTVSGTTAIFTTGTFTTLTGGVATITSGVFALGTAALPSISFAGSDTDTGIYSPDANQVAITTSGSGRLFVDASGNVGVGTESPAQLLHLKGSGNTKLLLNSANNTSDRGIYFATDTDSEVLGYIKQEYSTGQFQISSGTGSYASDIAFMTAGFERAKIDTSGRLLVGTSSSKTVGAGQYSLLNVQGYVGASNGGGDVTLSRGETAANITTGEVLGLISFTDSAGYAFGQFYCEADGDAGTNDYPGRLVFSTTADGASSPTERMRIANTGKNSTYSTSDSLDIRTSLAAGVGSYLIYAAHSATGVGTGGTHSLAIYTNGNIQNTNGSYTTLSDAKLKENIVDAGSQWNDLKAIQIRNWNFKAETGHETHRQIGPIAQELETVCPGLVFEIPDRDADGNETGEVTKGVNQSVLYMKAVKALQEAMERIETLEAKVAALESA